MDECSHEPRGTPNITESRKWLERATGLIPGWTQTLAKGPGQFVRGFAPIYVERAEGCRVMDVDGNEYIDLSMGVGPVSLGYRHPVVDRAILEQLELGITFSLPHRLEVEVAELIRRVVPGVDMVRFSKTGADVTSAAIRLARAYTGRENVLLSGYHGWHDWYVATTDRARGIPRATAENVFTFEYGDLDHLERSLDDETACVILEPVVFDPPDASYLREVRRLVSARGALLVFDEMWTGFRLALGGAQEYFDVKADLVTFSKALANGMPLSVLAGRGEVMELLSKDVFFYTTFGGEALSLAAAKATILEMEKEQVPAHLARMGARLSNGFNRAAEALGADFVRSVGMNYRTQVRFALSADEALLAKSLLQQEMIRRGVLWTGTHNLALAHGQDEVDTILAAYGEALPIVVHHVRSGSLRGALRGEPVEPIFRRTRHFNVKPRVP